MLSSATRPETAPPPQAHRVVAALADDHSAGEGLVVDLDAERPLPAVESVPLDEVEVVHSSNLTEIKSKVKIQS